GQPTPRHDVLVSGKVMSVRQNLFDFLHAVKKTKYVGELIWIDAICIDQSNSSERNHQVQQMGKIFERTMGDFPILHLMNQAYSLRALSRWEEIGFKQELFSIRDILEKHLFSNSYWSRAWVTQEIVLARNIIVL
ncbi:hypothetical protein K458DRAFT_267741, partial [Lentithecium fluviatile CBS 122367]